MKQIGLVLILFFALPAQSQIIMGLIFGDKLNTDKLAFGLHMDYGWNNFSGVSEQKAVNAFNLGLFFNYKLDENWRANLEMLAKYKRGAKGMELYDLGNDTLNAQFYGASVRKQIPYLSLPMSIQYVFKNGIFLELGPQVSFRLKSKDLIQVSRSEGELELERTTSKNVNPWDFGFLAGAGYKIGPSKLVSIGIRYQGGFSDVLQDRNGRQQHRQWGFYCNFPLGRAKAKESASPTATD